MKREAPEHFAACTEAGPRSCWMSNDDRLQSRRIPAGLGIKRRRTMSEPGGIVRPIRQELLPRLKSRIGESRGAAELNGERADGVDAAQLLLIDALQAGASDIHFQPYSLGVRVRLRIDGVVWDALHLESQHARVIINQMKARAGLDPVVRFTPHDAHAQFETAESCVDMRLALAPSAQGEILSIRLLDPKRLERSILELGLDRSSLADLQDWIQDSNGMFVSAGPTGSGKTTTVYALLHELKSSHRSIITLEDPVEYQIDGITQIQVDELHNLMFAEGAKAMLRLDPDYLMLGEIRDGTSAHTAVTSALGGRVLLSTIHARDAIGAVTALRNWGVSDQEIAESLALVLAQRLVRRLCVQCRKHGKLTVSEVRWFKAAGIEPPSRLWKPVGCPHCHNLGYRGRTGVFEMWRVSGEDYDMILNHSDEHSLRRALHGRGHGFVLNDALIKANDGLTTLEEVRRIAASSQLAV